MSIYEIVEHIVTSLRHSPSQLISSESSLGPRFTSRCLTNKLIDVESSIPIPCNCASIIMLSVHAHQILVVVVVVCLCLLHHILNLWQYDVKIHYSGPSLERFTLFHDITYITINLQLCRPSLYCEIVSREVKVDSSCNQAS